MTTSRARLVSVLLLLAASLLLAAGCGGDDSSDDSGGSKDSGSKSSDSGGGDSSEAKATFTSTCGGCHTLSDAGTTGSVGPNLDDTDYDADRIVEQIASGGGAMPPGLLEGDEAQAVADYVAGQAGN